MLRKRIDEAREQGFTLIELLIVIVVLGLLAGIVTLGVTKFSNDASVATCKATVDNVQIAVDAFTTQNTAVAPTTGNIAPYLKAGTTLPGTLSISNAAPYTVSDTKCP